MVLSDSEPAESWIIPTAKSGTGVLSGLLVKDVSTSCSCQTAPVLHNRCAVPVLPLTIVVHHCQSH